MGKIRDKIDIENTVEQFSNTIYKIAFSYTKSKEVSEDVMQNVFVRYMTSDKTFEDMEHKKAWLIKVTINECKKYFRRLTSQFKKESKVLLNDWSNEQYNIYDSIMELPQKYRIVVHLYYYEEFSIKEISALLKLKENTVMSLLHRARQRLKKVLEVEYEY